MTHTLPHEKYALRHVAKSSSKYPDEIKTMDDFYLEAMGWKFIELLKSKM